MKLTTTINGVKKIFEIEAKELLLDFLRREGYFGVKRGCETGDCGSCAVLVEGKAIASCLMFAAQIEGREVTTIEGLGTPRNPHPLQECFVETGGTQCGFCIPGMILSAAELLKSNSQPSQEEIAEALDGNLCRCTGYVKQFDAVKLAAKKILGSWRDK